VTREEKKTFLKKTLGAVLAFDYININYGLLPGRGREWLRATVNKATNLKAARGDGGDLCCCSPNDI